ncbi:class I SAM-dependent methyltransferase [Parendozoicomonas sp. Alg238-R29]|uniref:class I SAM-dependent methyltransferase n=1 Tax=Parendozoicomonas sp. Alg238-R29 TaxID=2993446 RepID=UPI00248DE14E|nr:class I SAM-dependent methyltransferase [Parendozoicomonas sp. Alg238-R29]
MSEAIFDISILATPECDTDQLVALKELTGLGVVEAESPKAIRHQQLVLWYSPKGLALQQTGKGAPGPVIVDFVGGAVGHRRKYRGGKSQSIVKAVGVADASRQLYVLDATAGLGRDAYVLATMGCHVTMIERSPVVRALLADGLARGLDDAEVGAIVGRMSLVSGHAPEMMSAFIAQKKQFDVVYLDPMFPHRDKSAAVKKEMVLFQSLLGPDMDADDLLNPALKLAQHRVVVKRPKKAPDLDNQEPGYRLEGKSGRFDIYPLKRF